MYHIIDLLLLGCALDHWPQFQVSLLTILIAAIHGSCRCRSTKSKFLFLKSEASEKFDSETAN